MDDVFWVQGIEKYHREQMEVHENTIIAICVVHTARKALF